MKIWPAVIELVGSKVAITNLIGTAPMRLFPVLLPQGLSDFPALAYRTVSITSNPTFDGSSETDHARLDFAGYDSDMDDVNNLIDTLRDELEDSEGTFAGVEILGVRYVDSGSDDFLEPIEKFTQTIEFSITYKR